ncbi:hypothetical protein Q7O_000878 [Pectobacterium carotovorum subsp. carotovorum PCCS1]|nr:hypothetical protein [Pectobacterium carotovorum subsp. carotovorum PCCS1]
MQHFIAGTQHLDPKHFFIPRDDPETTLKSRMNKHNVSFSQLDSTTQPLSCIQCKYKITPFVTAF